MSDNYRKTRFPELGYVHDGPNLWRIVSVADGRNIAGFWPRTGPPYASKAELLADLGQFAKGYGCADAV